MKHTHKFPLLLFCAAMLFSFAPLRAQTLPLATAPASVSAKTIAQQPGGGYVGADRCRSCHKPEFIEFNKTHHASLPQRKGVQAKEA